MSVTAETILADAAEILADPDHWFQGFYESDDNSACCALGAITKAYARHGITFDEETVHPASTPAAQVLEAVLMKHYPEFLGENLYPNGRFGETAVTGRYYTAQWNDHEGRTHAQVLEMFSEARALAAFTREAA